MIEFRGPESPILLSNMIEREKVVNALGSVLEENGLLLVDVKVNPQNRITVYIDGLQGVTIDQCSLVSRHIESQLDRDEEDYQLEVSSPGTDQPFRLKEQYIKNTGRQVAVVKKDGSRLNGKLQEVKEEGVLLETEKIEKIQGKKKSIVRQLIEIPWDQIDKTTVTISFK